METLSLPIAPGEELTLEVGEPRHGLVRWTKVYLAGRTGERRFLGATDWERHVFGTLMTFLGTRPDNEGFVSFWLLFEAHAMFYQARCAEGTWVKVMDGTSHDAVIAEFVLTPVLKEEWRRRLETAHAQIQSSTSPFQEVYSFKQYLSVKQTLEALAARGVQPKEGVMAIKPSEGFKPFVEHVKKITSRDTQGKEAATADASIATSIRELEDVIREAGIAEQQGDTKKYQNPKKTKDEAQKELAELAELRRQLEPLKS